MINDRKTAGLERIALIEDNGLSLYTATETAAGCTFCRPFRIAIGQIVDTTYVDKLINTEFRLIAQRSCHIDDIIGGHFPGQLSAVRRHTFQAFAETSVYPSSHCPVALRHDVFLTGLSCWFAGFFSAVESGRRSAPLQWADNREHRRRPAQPGRSRARLNTSNGNSLPR